MGRFSMSHMPEHQLMSVYIAVAHTYHFDNNPIKIYPKKLGARTSIRMM